MHILNKHMAHSATTSSKFYQYQTMQNAVNTHTEIKRLTEKQHFTETEDKAIIHDYRLTQDTTPSLFICQQICDNHCLNKTKNRSKTTGGQ